MSATLRKSGAVVADCPGCGAPATFEHPHSTSVLGYTRVEQQGPFTRGMVTYTHARYQLLRCANCGRGGLAVTFHRNASDDVGVLMDFHPYSVKAAPLPKDVPEDIVAEVREAERCAAIGAWRAGSAMLRSALEKTLTANGYAAGKLVNKIDAAAADTVITDARKQRAHDEIRVLGNDVLHDDWRVVDEAEYDLSHHYTQRVIEDFYDSRPQVEAILKAKGRITV